MDAALATETSEPSSTPVATSDGGSDPVAGAAPPPPDAPAPEPRTVTIHGQKVTLAELVRHFDPICPRCAEGIVMVGRPVPKGFKGVIRVPELCDCTVRLWEATHPAPAEAIEPEIGARARRALAGAPPPKNDHATKQAARLRAALERQREELAAAEAPIAVETAALDTEERQNRERVAILADSNKDARARLEALRAQVSGVLAEIGAIEEAFGNRETLGRSIMERRRQLEGKHAGVMKRADNLRADIEKLERRLALALAHEEAAARG